MKTYTAKKWTERDHGVHIFRCSRQAEVVLHTHDFIEIVYVREGSAIQRVNDIEYTVSRGDLLFLNYGAEHSFVPQEDFTYFNVSIYPETMASNVISPTNAFAVLTLTAFNEIVPEEGHGRVTFYGSARAEIENILVAMLKEQEGHLAFRDIVMNSYMSLLIMKIVRKVSGEIDSDEIWPEIAKYIEENLDQDLSLTSLANKCFYNPSYFSRIFKERYSIPLSEYVMKKRMEKAYDLLMTTDLSISAIASMVGFNNKSFFYKTFYKAYKKTPLVCRKEAIALGDLAGDAHFEERPKKTKKK